MASNFSKNTKRKTIKKKPKNAQWRRKWRKTKAVVLQKIGCLSIFLLVFLGLFVVLVYRFLDGTGPFNPGPDPVWQQQNQFLKEIAPTAQRLQRQYGVLASVAMSQAAIESNFGLSQLSADYNNLFGVKTDVDDPNGVNLPTLEFIDGEMKEMDQRFKVYSSWDESMESHAKLIYYGTTWDPHYYKAVLDGKTFQEQAKGLQQAGYATDPDYAEKIITMIETWQLDQYDQPTVTTVEAAGNDSQATSVENQNNE